MRTSDSETPSAPIQARGGARMATGSTPQWDQRQIERLAGLHLQQTPQLVAVKPFAVRWPVARSTRPGVAFAPGLAPALLPPPAANRASILPRQPAVDRAASVAPGHFLPAFLRALLKLMSRQRHLLNLSVHDFLHRHPLPFCRRGLRSGARRSRKHLALNRVDLRLD